MGTSHGDWLGRAGTVCFVGFCLSVRKASSVGSVARNRLSLRAFDAPRPPDLDIIPERPLCECVQVCVLRAERRRAGARHVRDEDRERRRDVLQGGARRDPHQCSSQQPAERHQQQLQCRRQAEGRAQASGLCTVPEPGTIREPSSFHAVFVASPVIQRTN